MSEATDPLESMPEVVDRDMAEQEAGERRGALSVFTCPECGGALWQVDEELALRFRCHVGHAYYGEALLAEQGESLEAALWTAVRIFREKTVLGCQLAARERALAKEVAAQRFEEEARLAQSYADVLLNLLQGYSAAG
jgi:two-component system chemotaxis response regulator CheB